MKEVELPSGTVLKIGLAPFSTARKLFQAILDEMKSINVSASMDMAAFFKDAFCYGFSSPQVEHWLWQCLGLCLYGAAKIDKDTFEPEEARQDYLKVCAEVVRVNVLPFGNALFVEYRIMQQMMQSTQESKPKTTTS